MNYRSHTPAQIEAARAAGEQIWSLDTGNDGLDDTLYGDYEEVVNDLLFHHDMNELPAHWTVELA